MFRLLKHVFWDLYFYIRRESATHALFALETLLNEQLLTIDYL